ncbi:hypothetical protein QF046_001122 [Microbacterium sp. W4I4]|uniref:hypothetical protein n=1 Tax=Microbacterium sp. W4I4 TaxID=3042295 RepID=UPI00277D5128|nr:hypothetical protein [Microbacterium sp. W4I4]MDQ0613481.1 hypothetical protein [Microbacterium sp. W4I4]
MLKNRILVTSLVVVIVLLIGGGIFLAVKTPMLGSLFATETEESSSQVITSITQTEEVSLLSLGIQGIDSKKANSKVPFLGLDILGSERATFLQYEFTAKLGFDGAETKIENVDEDAYRISIPEFIFIGHSDVKFELIADNSGGLSVFTPEIKQIDMVNKVLDSKQQAKYIEDNEQTLREQAIAFYTGIIHAIDPKVTLDFVFAGDPAGVDNG